MDDTRDGRIGVGLRIYRDRKSLRCARNHESYWGNGGHTGAASDGGPQGAHRGNAGTGYCRHSVYRGLPDRVERGLDTGGDASVKKVAGRILAGSIGTRQPAISRRMRQFWMKLQNFCDLECERRAGKVLKIERQVQLVGAE